MPRYLVDASALYPLILEMREKVLLKSGELAILDLTVYEVGNVLWKEYRAGRIKNLDAVSQLFQKVLENLHRFSVNSLKEVLEMAVRERLTFYDAAYLWVSEKNGLTLITEDEELLSKYPKAVRTHQIEL